MLPWANICTNEIPYVHATLEIGVDEIRGRSSEIP